MRLRPCHALSLSAPGVTAAPEGTAGIPSTTRQSCPWRQSGGDEQAGKRAHRWALPCGELGQQAECVPARTRAQQGAHGPNRPARRSATNVRLRSWPCSFPISCKCIWNPLERGQTGLENVWVTVDMGGGAGNLCGRACPPDPPPPSPSPSSRLRLESCCPPAQGSSQGLSHSCHTPPTPPSPLRHPLSDSLGKETALCPTPIMHPLPLLTPTTIIMIRQ